MLNKNKAIKSKMNKKRDKIYDEISFNLNIDLKRKKKQKRKKKKSFSKNKIIKKKTI